MHVERATPADVEALVQVQIAAFHNDTALYGVELGGPPGYDSVADTLKKISTCDFYKIMSDDQIIGGLTVYVEAEGVCHVDMIYLDPTYHNQGIGSHAMTYIEQTYPDAKKWTLHTPEWAIRNQHFYEKLGYVKVGEEVLPDITLYAYEKRLES